MRATLHRFFGSWGSLNKEKGLLLFLGSVVFLQIKTRIIETKTTRSKYLSSNNDAIYIGKMGLTKEETSWNSRVELLFQIDQFLMRVCGVQRDLNEVHATKKQQQQQQQRNIHSWNSPKVFKSVIKDDVNGLLLHRPEDFICLCQNLERQGL